VILFGSSLPEVSVLGMNQTNSLSLALYSTLFMMCGGLLCSLGVAHVIAVLPTPPFDERIDGQWGVLMIPFAFCGAICGATLILAIEKGVRYWFRMYFMLTCLLCFLPPDRLRYFNPLSAADGGLVIVWSVFPIVALILHLLNRRTKRCTQVAGRPRF
jgi:hypothetical protein